MYVCVYVCMYVCMYVSMYGYVTVLDPDLEIRGSPVIQTLGKGEGRGGDLQKVFVSPLGLGLV